MGNKFNFHIIRINEGGGGGGSKRSQLVFTIDGKTNASPSVCIRILLQLQILQMQMVQGDNHKACILAVVS